MNNPKIEPILTKFGKILQHYWLENENILDKNTIVND